MKKMICIAAALALTLIACSNLGLAGQSSKVGICTQPNDHCISVTIFQESGAWKIGVDNHELHVRGPNHVIYWRIDNAESQTYKFPEDGIYFKTAPGKKEFNCRKMNDTVFWCSDPNSTKGKFEYGIKVDGLPAVPPLDPFVVND